MRSRRKTLPSRPRYLQRKLLQSHRDQKRKAESQPFQYERLEPRQLLAAIQGVDEPDRQSIDFQLNELMVQGTPFGDQDEPSFQSGFLSQTNLVGNGGFERPAFGLNPNSETGSLQGNWHFGLPGAKLASFRDLHGKQNSVVNLTGSASGTSIFQDVQTDVGSKYVLTFDVRAQGELGNNENTIGLFWDGKFQKQLVNHDFVSHTFLVGHQTTV